VKGYFIFNIIKESCEGVSVIEFADSLFTGHRRTGDQLCTA